MKGVLYSVKNVISEYSSDTEGICFVSSDRVFADTLLSIREEIENVNKRSDIKRKGVIVFDDDKEQRGFHIAFPVEDQLKWFGCKVEPLIHDGYNIMKIELEQSKCIDVARQHGTMIAYKKLGEADLPHIIDSWLLIK